jgi:hypothetical protein
MDSPVTAQGAQVEADCRKGRKICANEGLGTITARENGDAAAKEALQK